MALSRPNAKTFLSFLSRRGIGPRAASYLELNKHFGLKSRAVKDRRGKPRPRGASPCAKKRTEQLA